MKSKIHPINETNALIDQLQAGIASLPDRRAVEQHPGWSGSPCPGDPGNYWIDDATGERIPAA